MAEYIHLFQTEAEFTSAFTNDYHEPWVSYTNETSSITFNKKVEPIPEGAVDLGLPSRTLWAACNVGASSPEQEGNYYAWGEVSVKNKYDWETYKFYQYDDGIITKYNDTDGKTELDAEDDVAHAVMGGSWHIPTSAQCQELIDNTTSTWDSERSGRTFTSNINGNSIFIPAAGSYFGTSRSGAGDIGFLWSTSLSPDNHDSGAYLLYFYSNGVGMDDNEGRCSGCSVRGVIG